MKFALPYAPWYKGSYSTSCSIYSMHSYCTSGKLSLIHNDYASLVSYITSKQMFEIYCESHVHTTRSSWLHVCSGEGFINVLAYNTCCICSIRHHSRLAMLSICHHTSGCAEQNSRCFQILAATNTGVTRAYVNKPHVSIGNIKPCR